MTPKTQEAFDDVVRGTLAFSDLHWKQQQYLGNNDLVTATGVVTQKGLEQTTVATFPATVMILGADVHYGKVVLPKGTEVMVTWRDTIQGRDLVDGFINTSDGMKEVRLYVSPRNTFEKRLMVAEQ